MDKRVSIFLLLSLFLFASRPAFAQATSSDTSSYLLYALVAISVLLILALVYFVSDNLMKVEAKNLGVDKNGEDYSLIPAWSGIRKPKVNTLVGNNKVTVFKKGHDILLEGEAEETIDKNIKTKTFALVPTNFIGMSPIPKVVVAVGDAVKAGDIIFFDKKRPAVKYVAPVSGEVIAINRGAKRSIANVLISADNTQQYRTMPAFDIEKSSRADLVDYLMANGAWAHINQRPYDMLPAATDLPKAIFISTFDSAPLAPNLSFVIEGKEAAFQRGLDVLNKLTSGKVHLGLNARARNISDAYLNAKGVEKDWFHGAHPAGNVGIQIHHTDPICAGEKVWTLGVQDVATIGAFFTENRYNAQRVLAITGAELKKPTYVHTYIGANMGELTEGNLANEKVRLISGDVLSGEAKTDEQYLNFKDDQLTAVSEGDYYQLFGWLSPLPLRPTISRAIPSFKDMKFTADTNTHGEKRAFVMTGQYEEVLPMDIYPQHLFKAIVTNDFERMEGLGIYELSEEDVALCEFACTSKQPLQQILREGLTIMREQG